MIEHLQISPQPAGSCCPPLTTLSSLALLTPHLEEANLGRGGHMSPSTQLHADAGDVDDSHLVSIALTGHEDRTCRAAIEVNGQEQTDCTELHNQCEIT